MRGICEVRHEETGGRKAGTASHPKRMVAVPVFRSVFRRAAAVLLAAAAAFAGQRPPVAREAMEVVEQSIDGQIRGLDPNDPYDLLGFTRGVYLPGYGVVLTAEVNLVITPITPFHPVFTAAQTAKLRERKVQRLPALREMMRRVLVDTAPLLDGVPPNEQIVFGVTLFYRSFEQREGLPGQIVMRAERQALVNFKNNRISRAQLNAAIHAEEL